MTGSGIFQSQDSKGEKTAPTPPPPPSALPPLTLSAERRPRDTVEDLDVFGTIERAEPKARGRRGARSPRKCIEEASLHRI